MRNKIGGSFTSPENYGFWTWCECCVDKVKDDMTLLEIAATLIGDCDVRSQIVAELHDLETDKEFLELAGENRK
jgi:hypothetical protein